MQPKSLQLFGISPLFYNPYSVSPQNTDRFFDWQFGRATLAIYGKSLRPEELPEALRSGLKPIPEQPRMEILAMAFGAASLLVIALLSAISQGHYLHRVPNFLRALLRPLGLPFLAIFAVSFFIPSKSSSFDPVDRRVQPLLLHLSAILPSNLALMTLTLLAALAPLYWALEAGFNQAEFPDKSKEAL
jgi:hypothetical protein